MWIKQLAKTANSCFYWWTHRDSWINFGRDKSELQGGTWRQQPLTAPTHCCRGEQELWRSSRSDRLWAKFVRPGFALRVDGSFVSLMNNKRRCRLKFAPKSTGVRSGQARSWHFWIETQGRKWGRGKVRLSGRLQSWQYCHVYGTCWIGAVVCMCV